MRTRFSKIRVHVVDKPWFTMLIVVLLLSFGGAYTIYHINDHANKAISHIEQKADDSARNARIVQEQLLLTCNENNNFTQFFNGLVDQLIVNTKEATTLTPDQIAERVAEYSKYKRPLTTCPILPAE